MSSRNDIRHKLTYLANSAATDFDSFHFGKVMIISSHICHDRLLIRKVNVNI